MAVRQTLTYAHVNHLSSPCNELKPSKSEEYGVSKQKIHLAGSQNKLQKVDKIAGSSSTSKSD